MKRIFICILIALCLLFTACKKEATATFGTGGKEQSEVLQATQKPSEEPGEEPSGGPAQEPSDPPATDTGSEAPQAHSHHFENGACTGCSEVIYTVLSNGNIAFGSYPQSEVTDATLCAALSAKVGTLPTATAKGSWSDFENESNSWYLDLEHEGERYRALYFTAYRPQKCNDTAPAATQAAQYQNGYRTGTVYWFKYEPLEFRILQSSQGKALLACVSIVDAQAVHTTHLATTVEGVSYSANNYAQSALRSFLNGAFTESAFRSIERSCIVKTAVDNSAATTAAPQGNRYACENTEDTVFLLSYADICTTDYGFSANAKLADGARQCAPSDYAKARGLSVTNGKSNWWLRSPCQDYDYGVYYADKDGIAKTIAAVYLGGILPALQITL